MSSLQVRNLLQQCNEFEQNKVLEMGQKVRSLLTLYQPIRDLPEVRKSYSSLKTRWEDFEKEVRKIVANMELALQFHESMLKVHVYMNR